MARARIVSARIYLPDKMLVRGDILEGSDLELQLLVRGGSAEWVEEGGEEEASVQPSNPKVEAEDRSENEKDVGPDFASSSAAVLAEAEGLIAADFAGLEPSGKTGFTKADVEGVLADKGGES